MFGFNDDDRKDERSEEESPAKTLLGLLKLGIEDGKVEVRSAGEMPKELRRLLGELESLEAGGKPGRREHSNPEIVQSTRKNAERLKELYKSYNTNDTPLEVGTLVQWKDGMANRRVPAYGQPGIVLEVLEPHTDNSAGSGDIAYREVLTHRIGFLDERDGEFLVFVYDGKRFEPYRG